MARRWREDGAKMARRWREDGANAAVDLVLQRLGRRVGDIGREMRLAALPRRAWELELHGVDQPAMGVRDDEIDSRQPASFEPDEVVPPTAFRLAVAQRQSQDLARPCRVDPNRQQRAARPHPSACADREDERIHQHERVALLRQRALIPGAHQRIESLAQLGDRRRRERFAAEFLGDLGHFAGGDAIDAIHHHLHLRAHQRLFAALGALEELGRERAVAHLGHTRGGIHERGPGAIAV
jgi:hypothetical protein